MINDISSIFFLLQLANVLQIDLQLVKVRFCCEVKLMFLCFVFIFCLLQMKEKKNTKKRLSCGLLTSLSFCIIIQNAVSVYIRLGFAHKKGVEIDETKLHHSWTEKVNSLTMKRWYIIMIIKCLHCHCVMIDEDGLCEFVRHLCFRGQGDVWNRGP